MTQSQETASRRVRLPAEYTTFVGRESEVDAVAGLLLADRLVALVGPAGVGKTRLALRIADVTANEFPDGVRVIDLSVPGTWNDLRLLDQSARALRLLVILDGCETSIDVARGIAARLVPSRPGTSLLVVSQVAVDLPELRSWRVRPLPVPDAAADIRQVAQTPSCDLLVQRLQVQQPGFRFSPENARLIAELCRRVDGLPLAIEAIAARAALLGVDAVHAADDIFDVIEFQPTAESANRTSLRASFKWSWTHLSLVDRDLLARLTVFADGFTFDAASFVCGHVRLHDTELVESLERLVRASLVEFDPEAPGGRYSLLRSTRAFAKHYLSADMRETLSARLVRWCWRLTDAIDWWVADRKQVEPVAREMVNLRAIFTAASDATDPRRGIAALHLYLACLPLWVLLYEREGTEWLARLERWASFSEDPLIQARLAWLRGVFAFRANDLAAAVESLERAAFTFATEGDEWGILTSRYHLAEARLAQGETHVASLLLSDVVSRANRRGHPLASGGLARLAVSLLRDGDIEGARRAATRALRAGQSLGHPWILMYAWTATGLIAQQDGDLDRALQAHVQAFTYARQSRPPRAWVEPCLDIATVHLARSDRAQAARVLLRILDNVGGDPPLRAASFARLLELVERLAAPGHVGERPTR